MVVGSGNSIQEIMRQKAELTGERDNLITQVLFENEKSHTLVTTNLEIF